MSTRDRFVSRSGNLNYLVTFSVGHTCRLSGQASTWITHIVIISNNYSNYQNVVTALLESIELILVILVANSYGILYSCVHMYL